MARNMKKLALPVPIDEETSVDAQAAADCESSAVLAVEPVLPAESPARTTHALASEKRIGGGDTGPPGSAQTPKLEQAPARPDASTATGESRANKTVVSRTTPGEEATPARVRFVSMLALVISRKTRREEATPPPPSDAPASSVFELLRKLQAHVLTHVLPSARQGTTETSRKIVQSAREACERIATTAQEAREAIFHLEYARRRTRLGSVSDASGPMADSDGSPFEYRGAIDARTISRRGWRPPGLPAPAEQAWVETIYVEESDRQRLLRDAERAAHRAEAVARRKQANEERKRLAKSAEEEKQRSAATQAMVAAAAKARKAVDDFQRRNATGRIVRAGLDHNAIVDGVRGTGIHVEFHVSGMEGTSGIVVAFLKYRDGTGVRNKNDKYGTSDGFVATGAVFTPGFAHAHYKDFSFFIPFTEYHLSVRRVELMWEIVLLTEPNGRELGRTRLECFWKEK